MEISNLFMYKPTNPDNFSQSLNSALIVNYIEE